MLLWFVMRKLELLNIRAISHLCRFLHCGKEELLRFCEHPQQHYHQFEMVVKGKKRPIAEPIGKFRQVLNNLKCLLDRINLPVYLHGGVKGCSPKTNAIGYICKSAVLNFDLQDFFPSVAPPMVYALFSKRLGCSPDVARLLTKLVTLNGGLPQGSPTSTVVGNLVVMPLVERLNTLAKHHGCTYSQFVDDGTISGPGYIGNLRPLIDRIISQEGLRASPKLHKRITRYHYEEQVVTGVAVNKRIDVPKEKVQEIRSKLRELRIKGDSGKKFDPKEISSFKGKVQYIKTLNEQIGANLEYELKRLISKAS